MAKELGISRGVRTILMEIDACQLSDEMVEELKYIGCIICGALAVIFGRWTLGGVVLVTLLFGFPDAPQLRLQILSPSISYQLIFSYLMRLHWRHSSYLASKKPGQRPMASHTSVNSTETLHMSYAAIHHFIR